MILEIANTSITNVWAEKFKGREGEDVEFYRALLNVPGEAPVQIGVAKDDFNELSARIGANGTALIELDARPGNRVRVYLKDIVEA